MVSKEVLNIVVRLHSERNRSFTSLFANIEYCNGSDSDVVSFDGVVVIFSHAAKTDNTEFVFHDKYLPFWNLYSLKIYP